jgi:hypothetical protein
MSFRSFAAAALVPIAVIAACGPAKPGKADTSLPHFTKAQFASIRWLDGRWRGVDSAGKPFFEAYRVVNDSTMHQGTFSDSTFATQTDSAVVGWRNGVVVDQGASSPWVATRLDSGVVTFALTKAATNRFVWIRHSPDEWEAQIYTPDRAGREQRVVYRMQRVRP